MTEIIYKSVHWFALQIKQGDLRYEKFNYFQKHSALDVWEGSE